MVLGVDPSLGKLFLDHESTLNLLLEDLCPCNLRSSVIESSIKPDYTCLCLQKAEFRVDRMIELFGRISEVAALVTGVATQLERVLSGGGLHILQMDQTLR